MSDAQKINSEVLECLIALTVKKNAPNLFELLKSDGFLAAWFPSALISTNDMDMDMDMVITSSGERESYERLSGSMGKLIRYCEAENETSLGVSLRYIKADIELAVFNFDEKDEAVFASEARG